MKRFALSVVLLMALLAAAGSVYGSEVYEGKFVVYLGGQEIGSEEFTISDGRIATSGSLTVMGQTVQLSSELKGDSYVLSQMGISIRGAFGDGLFRAEAGPVQLSYEVTEPYVVLDNNVFAQYQQVVDLAAVGVQDVAIVSPILVLMSQNPVMPGKIIQGASSLYQVSGENVLLDESGIIFDGALYVKLLSHDGRLVVVDVPAQGAQAVHQDYVGLTPVLAGNAGEQVGRSEEFMVPSGDVTLAGTLTLPDGDGPFPVILLNSGSGPQDRDGNTPPEFMTDMFKLMAEYFSGLGVAVLRYDERGVGESTGDYNAASLQDLVDDVRALVKYLKNHPQIDEQRIVILGHSEGAVIAPIIAAEDRELAGVVLLAGPSTPLDEIMIEQLEYQASLDIISEAERQVLDSLRPMVEQLIDDAAAGKDESVLPYNMEWLRQHMAHDPREAVGRVEQPVLIIHGEDDVKVLPYHALALAEALREAGNDNVEVHMLPKTTHYFTLFPIDNPAYDATNPWKLEPSLFELIGNWLRATVLD